MESTLFARHCAVKGPFGCLALLLFALTGCTDSNSQAQEQAARSEAQPASALAASQAKPAAESAGRPVPEPPAAGTTADWPGWRGPGGRGIALGAQLPQQWPANDPFPLWTAELGTGWSSPVVVDNRVVVTERRDGSEHLAAFDALSGKPLWKTTNSVDFDPHAVGRRHGNGPKSTAVVVGDTVFSLGIAGWLQAVDARTGKVRWHVNLPERFGRRVPLPQGRAFVEGTEHVIVPIGNGQGAPVPLFGYTGSLLAADGLVILSVGGEQGGTIMAFSAADGHEVWRALDEHVSYSSPVLAELSGVRQVVVMTGPRVVGLRIGDGRLLWSYPFQIQYDESISTPAVGEHLVLVTGDGHPLTALELPPSGLSPEQPIKPRVAWKSFELSSYLSSMLVHDGHLYGMGDSGSFACVRLSDGETLWSGGNHGSYCSPILAGNRLLGLNEEGELAVLAASPTAYRELGHSQLADGQTWTMPAVVGSRIYIRSANRLAAFDLGR